MKWFPIEDGFPENRVEQREGNEKMVHAVLCYIPGGTGGPIMFLTPWNGRWVYVNTHQELLLAEELFRARVTHWAELPAPPKPPRKAVAKRHK